MTDPLLEQLRAVFHDELSEQLAVVEAALVVLSRPGADDEEQRTAALDIRRAAHTLKGAARAVSYADVERLCHGLESALAKVPSAAAIDAAAVVAATRPVLDALLAWTEARAPRVPDDDTTPAAVPSEASVTALDTVRVAVRSVLDVSTASEELVVAARQGERVGDDVAAFDQAMATLRRQVRKITEGRRDPDAIEVQSALQAVATWGLEHRRRQHRAWSDVALRASRLSRSTRGLRATRFEALRPTLERTVLETASDVGKEVSFALHGGEAELDRRVVDRLWEPLVHLLRNAVDHGLETPEERRLSGKPATGRIEVEVRSLGTDLVVTLGDDGRGIDLSVLARVAAERGIEVESDDDLLTLLFEPGFTTRGETTRTSGRGIGLDVVRQRIAGLQGRVTIDTERGRGTRFVLTVPADLSVVRGQVVKLRGRSFVLVETAVDKGCRVHPEDERLVEGRRHLLDEGGLVPLADLGTALGIGGAASSGPRPAVVLTAGDRRMAYLVDDLAGSTDVVIKPLGPRVRRGGFVNGATVLPDGDLACVLDAFLLVQQGRAERRRDVAGDEAGRVRRVLVVDDSVTTRQLLAALLESAGYRVETAPDGEAAWAALQSREAPDLIVSDIEMPRVDGFQLLSRVRSSPHLTRMPVIIVTALASDADRRRALELGADAYVVKSRFDQQTLIDTVEELLP